MRWFCVVVILCASACASPSRSQNTTEVAAIVDTRVAQQLQATQNASATYDAVATPAVQHEPFDDARFGISFMIPTGFSVVSDDWSNGPPLMRQIHLLNDQGARLFIFFQDDGPPTPRPELTPTPSPTLTVTCPPRPDPGNFETQDEYDEAKYEYDDCRASRDYDDQMQWEAQETALAEGRNDPNRGYQEPPTPSFTVLDKKTVLVNGFPGLVEYLNHAGQVEYKLSAQFPDGFKIQISFYEDAHWLDELDYTVSTIRLRRASLNGALTAEPDTPVASEPTPTTVTGQPQSVVAGTVVYIVDGDTIDVDVDGTVQRVRYIGMDTPETKHPDMAVECFGPEASAKNEELVAGKTVYLEKDVSETDRYGRLLRYVWIGHPGALVMVNEELVRQGYASVATFPPDVKYQARFLAAQEDARSNGRGLWSKCH